MENKYFTPDIEDFHIGYECEIYAQCTSKMIRKVEWHPVKVSHSPEMSKYVGILQCKKLIKTHHIRVPYLTKEQIEVEGWELIQIYPKGACIFQKGTKEKGCELTYDFTEHRVHFTKLYFYGLDDEYTRTKLTWSSLECKDINTFRKIIKILNI